MNTTADQDMKIDLTLNDWYMYNITTEASLSHFENWKLVGVGTGIHPVLTTLLQCAIMGWSGYALRTDKLTTLLYFGTWQQS